MTTPLLSLWDWRPEFGRPLGCVATTFTFDAGFFEEEMLARFVGLESDRREDPRSYLIEREERLAENFACVLVDRSHVAPERSLRWHLLPCVVPRNGILHAKVSLLAWSERVRVLVGSANLTEPGYRRNLESMGMLEFMPDGGLPRALLLEVLDLLGTCSRFASGQASDRGTGPIAGLRKFITQVRNLAARWPEERWPRGEPWIDFLPVVPGGPSLFDQIRERVWSGTGPDGLDIVSPFYEEGPAAAHLAQALVEKVMGVHGERELRFVAPGRRLPDRRVEVDLPAALKQPAAKRCAHLFAIAEERDSDGNSRPLHAKHLWLERGDQAVQVLGSSNFTHAGMGVGEGTVNIEANLAYVLPSHSTTFAGRCWDAVPPYVDLDLARQDVRFLAEATDRTQETEGAAPLPEAFGLALFEPGAQGGRLRLDIGEKPPADFEVQTSDGRKLLSAAEWRTAQAAGHIDVPWTATRPPSHLVVGWQDKGGEARRSIWVVNVTDPALLPPPEELRALSLDELIEVLTSARPLHEALGTILRRRERAAVTSVEVVVDPHKRVDTRNFLLRRMRRLSEALEGLRQRLERPIGSLEALRWRLRGPVGPLALATRLAEGEGQAAAFMVTEVALAVSRVGWQSVGSSVGRQTIDEEVTGVLRDLAAMARSRPSPPGLAKYVEESLREAEA